MNGRTGDEMFISRFLLGDSPERQTKRKKEDNRKQKHLAAADDLINFRSTLWQFVGTN